MSHFEWENIDINAGNVITGIISNIDYENLTADVGGIGVGIPIHYHCEEDAIDDTGKSYDIDYPDDQDEEGASAFSENDVVLVMYRRVNNEDPVIVGFPDEAKNCKAFIVCNFDEKYYIVWDIRTRTYATILDPDIGGNISIPCLAVKLADWLEQTEKEDSEECYNWAYAGDKVNPTEETTPYLSANTGCGDLYNTWDENIINNIGAPCPPFPGTQRWYEYRITELMPAYNDQAPTPARSPHLRLWSFNLSNGLLGEDTHCFRSERTYTRYYDSYTRCPSQDPYEFTSYITDNQKYEVVFKTPIGDSEVSAWNIYNYYYEETTGIWTYTLTMPNSQDGDSLWAFYWKNKAIYSGLTYVQIYFTQFMTYSRDGYYAGPGPGWVYSNETWTRNNVVVAGANIYGSSWGTDPRNQNRDNLFEAAIEDLLNYVVDQEEIPEHRVIEGEFNVEIRR